MDHRIVVGEGPAGSVSMVGPEGPVRDLVMKSLLSLRDVQITTGHAPAVAYVRSDAFGADYLESLVSIAAMRIEFDSPRRDSPRRRRGERSRSCDTDRDRGHRRRAEARAAERKADLGRGDDLRREADRCRSERRSRDDMECRRDDTERRRDDTERRRDHTERRRDDTERRGRSADRGRSGKMHDKGRGRPRSHDADRAGPDKKKRM